MILRLRGKDGTLRIEVQPGDKIGQIAGKLAGLLPNVKVESLAIKLAPTAVATLLQDMTGTIGDNQMKHGDLLFLTYEDRASADNLQIEEPTVKTNGSNGTLEKAAWEQVVEDNVDKELEKEDGKIYRPRSPMCRHGMKGMCDYCMPLEPYDAAYLEEHKIKHLSFHSYLRKINTATNKPELRSSYMPPLSEPEYRIKHNCPSGHPSWPEGICTKCQPGAITLQQQSFRMVDHVEFSEPVIIDNFINFWRGSGCQRFGYLYGHYEPYNVVPLGVKAVVEAIYEPPQVSETDGVSLQLPWEGQKTVDETAGLCGLRLVGMIFTDLVDDGSGKGSVLCKRHIGSYYLSSLEINLASHFQSLLPNACTWSETGRFGSKFVTCVVSGNEEGAIDVAAYQVSNSSVAMVNADISVPSTDPGKMLVREEGTATYIPEVFYRKINEYGATVSQNAKPAFPVEYLLLTLTHGFPQNPCPTFTAPKSQFPVENRETLGQVQDLRAVSSQLGLSAGGDESRAVDAISDFHLLAYLRSTGILDREDEKILAEVATKHRIEDGYRLLERPGWQTLLTILRET